MYCDILSLDLLNLNLCCHFHVLCVLLFFWEKEIRRQELKRQEKQELYNNSCLETVLWSGCPCWSRLVQFKKKDKIIREHGSLGLVMKSPAKVKISAAVTLFHSFWHVKTSEIKCGRKKTLTDYLSASYRNPQDNTRTDTEKPEWNRTRDSSQIAGKTAWMGSRVHWSKGSMDTWEYEGSEQPGLMKSINSVYCIHRRSLLAASQHQKQP